MWMLSRIHAVISMLVRVITNSKSGPMAIGYKIIILIPINPSYARNSYIRNSVAAVYANDNIRIKFCLISPEI